MKYIFKIKIIIHYYNMINWFENKKQMLYCKLYLYYWQDVRLGVLYYLIQRGKEKEGTEEDAEEKEKNKKKKKQAHKATLNVWFDVDIEQAVYTNQSSYQIVSLSTVIYFLETWSLF